MLDWHYGYFRIILRQEKGEEEGSQKYKQEGQGQGKRLRVLLGKDNRRSYH
ncbi:hypothetical protein HYU92_03745 [Candidatus Curtissbacteria bacterium]|nr:hypothetical protein [Candidatus Curtissbacteria bacterium]